MAMPINFFVSLLLLLTVITATTQQPLHSPAATPLPPPPLSATQDPPPLSPIQDPPTDIQEDQLKNIIDALIGAGDFGGWASLLSSADSSAFPLTATLFIPSDDAAAHSASVSDAGISFDPFLIPYHVTPRRLTFSDLQHFAVDTRIPTLLPSKFIVITNNSASNFTVDGSKITQADIFSNAAFAVHGINNVLDYSSYGGAAAAYGGASIISRPPENGRKRENPVFPEGTIVSVRSGALELADGFWSSSVILLLLITLLVFGF